MRWRPGKLLLYQNSNDLCKHGHCAHWSDLAILLLTEARGSQRLRRGRKSDINAINTTPK
jgi:hypothetical protein